MAPNPMNSWGLAYDYFARTGSLDVRWEFGWPFWGQILDVFELAVAQGVYTKHGKTGEPHTQTQKTRQTSTGICCFRRYLGSHLGSDTSDAVQLQPIAAVRLKPVERCSI